MSGDSTPPVPVFQDNQTLKALEIVNIKLSAANETITLLNERLREKDAIIQVQNDKDAVKDEMIVLLKSANKDRSTVNTGDARMLEAANGIIAKQDAEISKLRNPGWFDTLFDRRTLGGVGVGYIGCKLTTGSNPIIQIPNPFQSSFQSPEDKAKQAMRLFTKNE